MALYAGQFGPHGLEFPDGRHAIALFIDVLNADGSMALLYTDHLKTAIASNPVRSDDHGNLKFFAVPGLYRLRIGTSEIEIPVPLSPLEPVLSSGSSGNLQLDHVHVQAQPVTDWVISHPLAFRPSGVWVEYLHEPGVQQVVPVSYPSNGVLVVHNGGAVSGKAYLS